ncbi:ribonuclease Z [Desulfohalobiaceae bacterium Ax17]|uniref:MBL fold metallo-hydrolase n=1 Tax=Desulfovulcanus ferrireducens TaxID=2831190 RepID=UPI00207BC652|nr:ribonuclease Z [Desulfovulcanus ferrireducens]MBT8764108.1 ribonuclease Z [Desulfovulcanus ferrireducens]
MKVIFCGVGEAFDENLANTSILVQSEDNTYSLLLDLGFTAASAYWQVNPNPLTLDAIWISHFHGDHFFGLPALLLRFYEHKRTKPLTIIGQPGIDDLVTASVGLAYPSLWPKLTYPVLFIEAKVDKNVDLALFSLAFAPTKHPQDCLGIKITSGNGSIFYSGDGRPTKECLCLAQKCDLVICEAYTLEDMVPGHNNVHDAMDFAREACAKSLALVHLQRDVRRKHSQKIKKILQANNDIRVFLPEPGDKIIVPGS